MTLNQAEHRALEQFRSQEALPQSLTTNDSNLLSISLRVAFEASRVIRQARLHPDALTVKHKADQSPATNIDEDVEQMSRAMFGHVFPEANYLGEETGGSLDLNRLNIAMDPVDGTMNLISHAQNNSVTLALTKGRDTILGLVANPATGEIAYAQDDHPTRLVQLGMFGEPDQARELPSLKPHAKQKLLVDLQPKKESPQLAQRLQEDWEEGTVRHVKGTAGSPALGLMEAAKGHYTYVHPWSDNPSTPFDLAPGVKLIQNAGGIVAGMQHPIDHEGLFVAGINQEHVDLIYKQLSSL